MKALTVEGFWDAYRKLPLQVRQLARKAFQLWQENPFHPSLHFKCIDKRERIWAARITRNYRVLGIMDEDGVTWFWIGDHAAYEDFFG